MAFQTCPGMELIPGYRLLERLGQGGFGEVWKATAPGGLTKALKIVFGHMEESRASQELKALDRIKSVRHPFLLSLERVEIIDNQLLIVTELAEGSLLERFQACRSSGLTGIPRSELLIYMRDAAEALDYMNENFGLQHLDIKPQNLLLVGGRMKIADFGLVKDLRGGSATITGGVTPFYATPEAFDGRVSRFSDQYSLAIVYQEMLTGLRPFPGTTALQLALQHGSSTPLLHPLPVADRPIIARALSKVPDQRFPTCKDMVGSLPASADAEPASPSAEEHAGAAKSRGRRKNESSVKQGPIREPAKEDEQVTGRPVTPVQATPPASYLPLADSNALHKASSLPLTKPISDMGLRPTLLVGIGGMAGWTLRKLRQKLSQRFGDLGAVPVLRLLLIDTDRTALQQARQGELGEALEVGETLPMPLQRPENYRRESAELLKWLERHWLHNVPRSLLTEGLRPLGRLALVCNFDEVRARLRESLSAATSVEAKSVAAESTGVSVRNEPPQIFVLASIAGGTGGGAVLDIAYTVRQVLQELDMPRAKLCGILMHATNQHPAEQDLARLNTFVTLQELQHYSQPSSFYPGDSAHGIGALGPSVPPFDDCYLAHLGEHLRPGDLQTATNRIAEYLYVNLATSVGAFLERWRRASRTVGVNDGAAAPLRGFGVHRYGFPKNRLARLAAGRICCDIVERWQGGHLDCSEESVREEVCAQMTALGVEAQEIEKTFCAAALRVLGEDAERYFVEKIARFPALQPGDEAGKRVSPELVPEVLTRIDAFFAGVGDVPFRGAQVATPLDVALSEHCKELSGRLIRPTLQWLISRLDSPTRRLRGAFYAANVTRQQVNAATASVSRQLEQVRIHQTTVREGLLTGSEESTGSGLLWLGGQSSNQLSGRSWQPFAEYFLFRMKERTLTRTLHVLDSVGARIAEWIGELDNVSQKLRSFGQTFLPPTSALDLLSEQSSAAPAETEMLPRDARSLADAAEQLVRRLPAELAATFEEAFQAEITSHYGGLWGLTCSFADSENLVREALLERALQAVLPALAELEAAHLFLQSRGDSDRARQELKDRALAAAPNLDLPGEMQQLIVGLPKSAAGSALRDLLDVPSFTIPSTLLDTDGDVVFCHESAGLPLQEVAALLVGDPDRYADLAPQVTTRKDVAWSFAELSRTRV